MPSLFFMYTIVLEEETSSGNMVAWKRPLLLSPDSIHHHMP